MGISRKDGGKKVVKSRKKDGKHGGLAETEGATSGRASRFTMSERNLGLMQEIIRKDPESYKEEFLEQFNYFVQTMKLLHIQPEQSRQETQSLTDSVLFLSGLAKHYPQEAKQFSDSLLELLREQAAGLDPDVRMSFCKALVLLRNQEMVDPIVLLETFFELVKVEDKVLRKFVLASISAHLKRIYHKKKDVKMLGKIQNLCFSKMKDSRSIVARAAQLVCIDAFRRKFWRDARTANVIAEAFFHKVPKIQVTSMRFFLGSENDNGDTDDEDEVDSDAEDNKKTLRDVMTSFRNVKKTRKRAKNVERAKKMINKKKKQKKEGRSKECNLMAIQSLYDPQEVADKIFATLETKKVDKFESRLLRVALCARIIGIHRLHTLSFYSYLHRFLQPKQRDVTKILLYAAQACHEMVPPDTVEQLIRVIAMNFVTDRNSPEAMTVGINAIREILSNCPFAATQELLRDLSEYKTYKNKNVSMAARSLITLFRAVNPKLLARKDRGKPQENGDNEEKEYSGFARPKVHDFISGAEILEENGEGEQGHLEDDDEESDLDVSDVDTDDVDTDEEEDQGPAAKKRRIDEKPTENDGDEESEEDEEEEEEDVDDDADETEHVGVDDEEEDAEDEEEDDAEDEEEEDTEDEEEEDGEEIGKATETKLELKECGVEEKEDPNLKAVKNSMDRILTQEDFKNIRAYQLKKQLIGEKRLKKQMGKGRSNADERIVEEMTEKLELKRSSDGLVRLSDIEHFYKKKKQSKEERMADVAAGRADEDYKFGRPKKNGPHVGRTNEQNSKKKVFAMVKNKVRGRNRQRSFRDQQKSLRNYLMRQSGRKPK